VLTEKEHGFIRRDMTFGTEPGEFDLMAQIDFPQPSRAASEDDWQKNLSAPLAGCRVDR